MKYDFDIAVIGAGSGGLSVAYFCANASLKTVLFEGHNMGGDCLNYGCVPSKAFIKSSKVRHYAKTTTHYGIEPVAVPDTDGSGVLRRVRQIIEEVAPADSQQRYEEMGAVVVRGHAVLKDKHTISANGKSYSAKYIVIATGSSPARLSVEGLEEAGYIDNESFFSLEKLPGALIMIGSGPIGLELSMAMAKLGVKVTMLEKADKFIPRFDEDISAILKSKCEQLGIEILCGTDIISAGKADGKKQVKIKRQGAEQTLEADDIFTAAGRRPNIFNMGLDDVGIEYTKRGITVDKRLRTNIKNIYAIGDCNGQMPFTHGASYQAGIAIRSMIFKLPAKTDYTTVPWVLYTDPEVASIGYSEKELASKGIDHNTLQTSLEHVDRAVTEGSKDGFVKIFTSKKGKLLGAVVVAQNAGEMLPVLVLAMQKGMKAGAISAMTFSYPTMAESIKRAVNSQSIKRLTQSKSTQSIIRFLGRL